MFHTSAFFESINPAGVLQTIAAVREETLFVTGDDLRVPTGLPFLIGAACAINDASAARAQVQSPSLRIMTNLDVEPIVAAATFGEPPEILYHPENPIPLVADEALNFAVQSAPAGAVAHYGVVWLADGPQQPVQGTLFTIRATGAIQQVVGSWVNGNLVFSQTLPAGRYAVVGLRARSADAIAARLVFPDQIARPGVLAVNAIGDEDPYWPRLGRTGVYGTFPHTNPPTIDVLGGVAATQTFVLDLVKL